MTTLPTPMPEPQFWQLLTHIDHPSLLAGEDEAASLEPLSEALLTLPPAEIEAFALRLADRLEVLLIASRQRPAPFGDDGLLYSACYAIARGQAWFEASRRVPGLFEDSATTGDDWCESLLYVAREAWAQATGQTEDDFPVWSLEDGLPPFASSMPPAAVLREEPLISAIVGGAASTTYGVYCHFEQHPSLERTVEPDANVRVGLQELLDDYFWCLLDLGDFIGLVDEADRSFQFLYDASKNLYWAEIPDESTRSSSGQEYSREALLALLHRLPQRFGTFLFDDPQTSAWKD